MAFLKPTKLNIDDNPKVNYVDSFIEDSIEFNKEFSIEIHKEIKRRKTLLRNNYKAGEFIIDKKLIDL